MKPWIDIFYELMICSMFLVYLKQVCV